MKTIFKILVILTVAVMVGGLLYGSVTAFSSNPNQIPSNGQLPPDGELNRPIYDGENDGIQFPIDSIKNLAIITVIGSLYLNAPKFLGKRKTALAAA